MKSINIKNIPSEAIRTAIYYNIKVISGYEEIKLRQMVFEPITMENNVNNIRFKIWKAEIPDPRFDNEEYETEITYNFKDGDIIEFYNHVTLNKLEFYINKQKIDIKWKRSK